MQLIVDRKQLHRAFQSVGRAVSDRSTLPVLTNVLIESQADCVRLAATDMEIGIERLIEAETSEPFAITLPFRTLTEILSKLEGDTVTLTMAEQTSGKITCGRSTYRVLGLSSEEFPPLPEVAADRSWRLPSRDLAALIRFVLPALAEDITRPILAGVLIECQGKTLRMVTTDSHRLQLRAITLDEDLPQGSCIVPGSTMKEILAALDERSDSPVTVAVDENQIKVETADTRITGRLVAGTFLNYQRVIPKSYARTLTVSREPLLNAVRRLSVVAKEGQQRLTLNCEAETLTLSASAGDLGEGKEELPAVLDGEPITLILNWRFLLAALEVLDSADVTLSMNGEVQPVTLRAVGDATEHVGLIMPMSIS